MGTEKIHCGDNLEYMKTLPSESIDLIYGDILYGTGRNFGDYQDIKADRKTVEEFYIPRITEMHRLLKPTGSIYLQMDTRINHYIRIILEDIFGAKNFRNEIVWCYNSQGKTKLKYNPKHDVILFFSKSKKYIFNYNLIKIECSESTKQRFKKSISENGTYGVFKNGKFYEYNIEDGSLPLDWFSDINFITHSDFEKEEYYSQKPLSIMNKFILASSNEGDVCADFFAGSGSFGVAAKRLNRNIILCDINPKAIELSKKRLQSENNLFNSL